MYHVCVDGNALLPTLSVAFTSNVYLFPFSNTTLEISNLRLNINWITLIALCFIKNWVKCFRLTYIYSFFMYILINSATSSNLETKLSYYAFHIWFEKINVANLKGILSNSKNIKDLSSLTSLLIDRKKIVSKCRMLKFKET